MNLLCQCRNLSLEFENARKSKYFVNETFFLQTKQLVIHLGQNVNCSGGEL